MRRFCFVFATVLSKWTEFVFFGIAIGIYKPQDIRPILTAYHGKDIAIEYGKKEAEQKQKFLDEWRKSGKARSGSSGGGLTFSGLFGSSSVSISVFTHYHHTQPNMLPFFLKKKTSLATTTP